MHHRVWPLLVILSSCTPPPASQPPTAAPTSEPGPVATHAPAEIATAEPTAAPPALVEDPPNIEVTGTTGWPQFHGNVQRTGSSSANMMLNKPRIAWKSRVGIQSWLNAPITLGKTLVVVPSSGKTHDKPDPGDGVVALDLRTGKRAWFAHFAQDANGVAANDQFVFATSDDEHLYALDIKTGKVVWKARGSGKMYTHPLLIGDLVVVGDAGGYARAIATADGKERWKAQLTGAIRGGAASDGKNIYVASEGGDVAAFSLSGKQIWKQAVKRHPWSGKGRDVPVQIYSPPIVAKDTLIIPFARDTYYTGEPAIYGLDIKTGNVTWRAKGADDWGNIRSTPVLIAGMLVYAEPYSGDIVGVAASTGRVKYRVTVGACYFPSWASPAAAGDLVYVPRFDGTVYAVHALSGKVAWQIYIGDSSQAGSNGPKPGGNQCEWTVASGSPTYSPAAVAEDGTLLVGNEEGYLYAIR